MLFDDLKLENMKALKNKDTVARSILSIVVNKAMLLKIEKRAEGKDLTDADVLTVITKTIKELDEEIKAFESANRSEKVAELKSQKDFIKKYLPQMMSEEEIKAEIDKLEDKSIPSVMKHFKMNFQGKCDMRLVNKIASSSK